MSTHLILLEVAAAFELQLSDLTGRSRRQQLVEARWVAMFVLRRRCPHLSLADIGQTLGGRDHTTVLHGIAVLERRLASEERLRRIVAGLLVEGPIKAPVAAPAPPAPINTRTSPLVRQSGTLPEFFPLLPRRALAA